MILIKGCSVYPCLLLSILAANVGTALADGLSTAKRTGKRPNVIVILTDDQGWGDLSINGNTNLSTPNIDQLARDGASFDRFFVCPVCSPTRAEFLTGRYHARSGVYSTSAGGERMNLDEVTIADTFKAAGYKTAAFGKWHNGMQYPFHPNGRGFAEFYGFCSGHWGNYFDPMLEHNGRIVKGNGFVIDDLTDRLIGFVEANKDQPFFAYLPYNTPHSPMQVPDRWWDKFKGKDLLMRSRDPKKENVGHTRAALAMCENIDWNVGRILKKLDQLDLSDDTVVVYFCDNGPNGARWNGGMKGRKGSTDEGGVRSPLFVRWPEKISRGQRVEQIASATDLLPTLATLCDVPIVGKKKLDGIDLSNSLLNAKPEASKTATDRMIVSHWRDRVSVRTQRFRFDNKGALFDMVTDPGQRMNVADQHVAQVKKFRSVVDNFRETVLKGYDIDQRPFVLGHPDYLLTQIPARDGKAFGNISRSNRFPNCSFFTNWKSVNDKITWDVEVGQSGRYRVQLYYTCRAKNVGTVIELSCGESKLRSKISIAHDPELFGQEKDRVKRTESYVKEFKALDMGKLFLNKGKSELKLQAVEIPGDEAIDFRLLMFERE